MPFTFDFKKLLENELRFATDVVLEYFAIKLKGFRINFSKVISLFIILYLFIHNSRSKNSRKATAQASLTTNNCFQF